MNWNDGFSTIVRWHDGSSWGFNPTTSVLHHVPISNFEMLFCHLVAASAMPQDTQFVRLAEQDVQADGLNLTF